MTVPWPLTAPVDQLRQAGAVVTTTETVLFQLLGQADTEEFRELARLIR